MPVTWDKLFEALVELSRIKDLKATTISSVKAGLITGAGTVLGGLLLGRLGLLLGGAICGGVTAAAAQNIKPVWIVLRDLPESKRQHLLTTVIDAFKNIGIEEVALIITFLASDVSLQSVAIKALTGFFKNNMNLQIT